MNYVFGIDLGTTYSCIAYMDEYGKPVVLKNSDGDHTTPSVVMVESADNVVVGMEAKRSIEVDPDRPALFQGDEVPVPGFGKLLAPEVHSGRQIPPGQVLGGNDLPIGGKPCLHMDLGDDLLVFLSGRTDIQHGGIFLSRISAP